MKGLIIYFSMTGNTKKIAQAIHKGMCKIEKDCDIIRLKDIEYTNLSKYDLIGIGGPVIHLRETPNITNFIECILANVEGKHGFAFCTHGAFPAYFLSRVVPSMQQRGLTIIGWNDWFGGVYHPACPKPYFTDGHPDGIDLREAEEFGKELVNKSIKIYNGETDLIPDFPRGKEYDDIYWPAGERPELLQPKDMASAQTVTFKINRDKCKYPKCTFCIDNCPMDAIDFSMTPPLFNKNCDRCWQCEMTCPSGAIEVDYTPFQKVHDVKPGESLLEKALEAFETQGRFRRLVPLKDIGWNTTFGNQKKPRYKIQY